MKATDKEYKHLAKEFQKITGWGLRPFVFFLPPDNEVVINILALEYIAKPRENESLRECLHRQMDKRAVEIIEKIKDDAK